MLSILIFVTGLARAECPSSSPAFMRMLGAATATAGTAGVQARTALPDADTTARIVQQLDRAITCSRYTLEDCGLHLLPARMQGEPGPYRAFMRDYVEALERLRDVFARLGAGEDVSGDDVYAAHLAHKESFERAHAVLIHGRR